MEILAVVLARVTALTNLPEWDPRGKLHIMDFVKGMVERYGFQKFPKTIEEYQQPSTGAVFSLGKMGNIVIENYTVYARGVVIDTRSSTDDSERVLKDVTDWLCGLSGIEPSADRISRRFYLSQVNFRCQKSLDVLNPNLPLLAARLTEIVSGYAKQHLDFQTTGIGFQFDATQGVPYSLPLKIERLEGAQFSENKYFSAAPLQTDEHIRFLEDFETILAG
jgi:hypothetical protein